MTESVKKLKGWVDDAQRIVFFGGAVVSTESGIPDFRSTGGLYHQEWAYPPEVILSHTFYKSNPEEFFRFYRAKLLAPEAKPNAAHRKLAEWEAEGGRQDEQAMIGALMAKRRYDPDTADWKERRRMYAFLLRKGFSAEAVNRAMREACGEDPFCC